MRNTWIMIFLVTAAAIAGCRMQPLASTAKLQPEQVPDYAALYQGILEELKQAEGLRPRLNFHAAVIAARLYAATGDPARAQDAVMFFGRGLTAVSDQKEGRPIIDGFHEHRSFGMACLNMQRQGLLTDQDRVLLQPIVEEWLKAFVQSFDPATRRTRKLLGNIDEPYVDHNIRLANMVCGAALSAYLRETDQAQSAPLRQQVDALLADYWNRLMPVGDLDENASNYTALGQAFLLDLAHILGRMDDLAASRDFRRMFTRCRDMVSPSGLVPEYGDSYFSYQSYPLDICYVLESAAQLYQDRSLLVPARKFHEAAMAASPGVREEDNWIRGFGLITLDPFPYQPAEPDEAPSRVTRRNRRQDHGIERDLVDKLILKTGRAPGSAMIMMDLYASGSHAHLEKGPSIAYYETAGVPLFHNMGRHGVRSAINGNLFWTMPEYDAFPGTWEAGKWQTMTIPLHYLPKVGENEYRIGDNILFRNFQERNRPVEYLYLDHCRLEGTAGTLLIDDFEDASTWHRNVYGIPGVELSQSADATQGQYSQRVNWGILPSGFCTRFFKNRQHFNFSGKDYQTLKFDVKYIGPQPYINLRNVLETPIDLGNQVLPNTIASAHAEQRGDDTYGEVNYSQYTVGNARLTRRIILTREGILMIQDTCTPSPEMTDWTGGQLWQLYELAQQGDDWFCSVAQGEYPTATDGQQRMLVKFSTNEHTGTFAQNIVQEYYQPNPKGRKAAGFFTVGTRRRMIGTQPQTFTMVVVPHEPTADAAALADGITFSSPSLGATTVAISSQSKTNAPIQISMGPDGWDVRR